MSSSISLYPDTKKFEILGMNGSRYLGLISTVFVSRTSGPDHAITKAILNGKITEPGIYATRYPPEGGIKLFKVTEGGLQAAPYILDIKE